MVPVLACVRRRRRARAVRTLMALGWDVESVVMAVSAGDVSLVKRRAS